MLRFEEFRKTSQILPPKKMKLKNKLALISLASLLAFSTTHAATIIWDVQDISETNGDESDVSKRGDLIEAVNFGDNSSSTTINTVTFEAFNGASAGSDFTFDNLNTLVDQSADSATFYTEPNTSYNALLQSLIFDTITSEAAYTLTGLAIGRDYEVQLFIADDRGGGASNFDYLDVDGNGTDLNGTNNTYFGGGPQPALVFTGTFTADALTQDFTALRRNSDDSENGTALSAYQLRIVPEPSSTALLGLGGLAFALRRRRNC